MRLDLGISRTPGCKLRLERDGSGDRLGTTMRARGFRWGTSSLSTVWSTSVSSCPLGFLTTCVLPELDLRLLDCVADIFLVTIHIYECMEMLTLVSRLRIRLTFHPIDRILYCGQNITTYMSANSLDRYVTHTIRSVVSLFPHNFLILGLTGTCHDENVLR